MSRPETSRWDFSIRALNLLLQLFVTIYSIFGVLRSHFGANRAEGIRGRPGPSLCALVTSRLYLGRKIDPGGIGALMLTYGVTIYSPWDLHAEKQLGPVQK